MLVYQRVDLVSCIYNHPGVGVRECSIIVPLDILDKSWQPWTYSKILTMMTLYTYTHGKIMENMGLSENRGYPQIAILMRNHWNMVIIHWNMRYTIFRQTHMSACVSQRLPIAAEMPPSSLGLFFPQNLGGLAGGCCYSYDPQVVDPWFARDPQPSGHNASYLGRENHLPFQCQGTLENMKTDVGMGQNPIPLLFTSK